MLLGGCWGKCVGVSVVIGVGGQGAWGMCMVCIWVWVSIVVCKATLITSYWMVELAL